MAPFLPRSHAGRPGGGPDASGGWLARSGGAWLGGSSPAAPVPAGASPPAGSAAPLPLPAGLLCLALVLPTELSLSAGPLRLSPYRMVLLVAFLPALLAWCSGRVGRALPADLAVAFFGAWGTAALAVNHGGGTALESGGILLLESFGAYLVGRTAIRGLQDFDALLRRLALLALLLLPLLLAESLSGVRLVHSVAGAALGGAPAITVEPRFGLARAFGPFDHPILAGVFCATLVALGWAAGRDTPAGRRLARAAAAAGGACASLSSAALMAAGLQLALMGYRTALRAVRARWGLLLAVALAAYAAVSVFSSRSGLQALLWYLALDRSTASYRLLIWEHGSANVAARPWFGLGFQDWERPEWMSPSVDSFWLLTAMTYGLPAVAALAAAVVSALRRAGRHGHGEAHGARLRRAWVFALLALAFCGFTVHYWNNVFVLLFFLLGAGAWMGAPDAEPVA